MRILAVWLVAAAVVVVFIAFTSIGPVFYSWGWYHGIHYSDVVVTVGGVGIAGWLTRRSLVVRGADG